MIRYNSVGQLIVFAVILIIYGINIYNSKNSSYIMHEITQKEHLIFMKRLPDIPLFEKHKKHMDLGYFYSGCGTNRKWVGYIDKHHYENLSEALLRQIRDRDLLVEEPQYLKCVKPGENAAPGASERSRTKQIKRSSRFFVSLLIIFAMIALIVKSVMSREFDETVGELAQRYPVSIYPYSRWPGRIGVLLAIKAAEAEEEESGLDIDAIARRRFGHSYADPPEKPDQWH